LIGALAALAFAAQAAPTRNFVRIIPNSRDGDSRFYTAYCPDHRRVTLEFKIKEHKICYVDANGKQRCLNTTDTDRAGRKACGLE
jgi:hypothetical protein